MPTVRRRGGIYTLDLGEGFEAWVGLTQPRGITRSRSIRLPASRTCRWNDFWLNCSARHPSREGPPWPGHSVTSPPYNSFLQLEIATPEDAGPAAEELLDLVHRYGLPHSRRYASPDGLLAAFEEGGHVGNPERANLLIPTLHLLRGEADRATSTAQQHLLRYGNDLSMANVAH